jgi:putative ABC transport system permease protein
VVGLDETEHTGEVQAALRARLPGGPAGLAVLDWQTRAPFYGQVRNLYAGIFWFLGLIVFVLVCLATSNTLLMAVMERMRELGTLLAIGTGRGQVAAIVVLEAVWLGLLGGLAGGVLGLVAVVAVNASAIQMPPPPGAVSPIELHLSPHPTDFLGVVLTMMVVLAVASIPPALRSVRLKIVDALGHV